MKIPLTRRELLLKCAALGSLTLAPSLSLGEAVASWQQQGQAKSKPTSWDEIGPFYKRAAPQETHLRLPGDA